MSQNKNVAIAAIVVIVLALALMAWCMFKPASTVPAEPGATPMGRAKMNVIN